jgi:hypothetical protein
MDMIPDINAREFGQLEAEVRNLKRIVEIQAETLKEMNRELETISHTLSEAKGGWRTILWLSGASATIGATITWAASHIHSRPIP